MGLCSVSGDGGNVTHSQVPAVAVVGKEILNFQIQIPGQNPPPNFKTPTWDNAAPSIVPPSRVAIESGESQTLNAAPVPGQVRREWILDPNQKGPPGDSAITSTHTRPPHAALTVGPEEVAVGEEKLGPELQEEEARGVHVHHLGRDRGGL